MSTKVQVRDNGPLRIEGDFEITDSQGNVYGLAGRQVIGLCRCGASEKKPFCDGKHNAVGFKSDCQAFELPPPPAPKA